MSCHMSYNVVCTVKPQYLKLNETKKKPTSIVGFKMLKSIQKHRLRLSKHFDISIALMISIFKTLKFNCICILYCCMYQNSCNVVCKECKDVQVSWYSGPCCTWHCILVHWPFLSLYYRLPEGLTQLGNLTQLYLNDTFLDYLPGTFGRWEPVCYCSILRSKISNKLFMINLIKQSLTADLKYGFTYLTDSK